MIWQTSEKIMLSRAMACDRTAIAIALIVCT